MSGNFHEVVIVVAVLLAVETKSQIIPDCKDQRGVFIAEPNNIKATCRAESVLFHCEHKFGSNVHPLWIINNETYERSQLPRNYFYDGKALSVKYPKLKQNNTSYQCVVESPPAFQNAKSACFYRSAVGYLWVTCDAPEVQCSPIYDLHERETLKLITTNITKVDDVSTYIIIYSDAISGNVCGLANISAISCNSGICSHVFTVLSHRSICKSDINVTVSADNLVQSEPIKIDSDNAFLKVSFDMSTPSITCKFINQPKKNKKFYTIEYGPVTEGCKDLPYNMEGYLSNSNSVTLQLHDLLHKDEISEICFVIKAHNDSKTITVEGVHKSVKKLLQSNDDMGVRSDHAAAVAAATVLVCGAIIVLSLLIFSIYYYRQLKFMHTKIDLESIHQSGMTAKQNKLEKIDQSTTFFGVHEAPSDKQISMKKFAAMLSYHYYDPQDGFGYFYDTSEQIPLNKKVILMDKLYKTPKFLASNFSSSSPSSEQGWGDVYVQNREINKIVKPGMKFLYCARSKTITTTSYFKCKSVEKECTAFEFAEEEMPGFQEIWIRYLYFQFTEDKEDVRPDQRIIVQKKDGKLVTGSGVRHLLGATGDCSLPIDPSILTVHEEWEYVFIQTTRANKQLKPKTKLLFCALMEKIPKNIQHFMYDIRKKCKMEDFRVQEILSFKPETGYGYYEFKEEEYLNLNKNVVLMHKDGSLYSGPGAKFFCTGDHSFEFINDNKILPPSLEKTDWSHIFIQSHSKCRQLLPGTKFLYLEYQTAYMKDDDDDEDTFRYTWSSS